MDYLAAPQTQLVINTPARCSADSGAAWIGSAWTLFKRSWLEFLVALILMFVLYFLANQIPLLSAFLAPLLAAGYLELAHRTQQDTDPSIGNLFAAFGTDKRDRLVGLLQLGGLSLLFAIVMVVLLAVGLLQLLGGLDAALALAQQAKSMTPEQLPQLLLTIQPNASFFIWLAGCGVLLVFYSCAVWFAVPLLWFSDKGLLEVMSLSLEACKRNVLSLLVFALLVVLLLLVALIPFGLGLLVAMPVLYISSYTSFRQIFVDQPTAM